jgi:hypothetical protein
MRVDLAVKPYVHHHVLVFKLQPYPIVVVHFLRIMGYLQDFLIDRTNVSPFMA